MNKIVVITNPDDTISIVHPAPNMFDPDSRDRLSLPELDGKTDEEILQWIIAKDVPEGLKYRITDISNLPAGRTFRNAWHDNDPTTETVDIDIDKAQEIKLDEFRALRAPLLDDLDREYLRADESGDIAKKKEIAQEKQILRDITQITLPNDVEQLKEFLPEALVSSNAEALVEEPEVVSK